MVVVPATAEPLVAAHVPRVHPIVTRDYSLFSVAIHDMVERICWSSELQLAVFIAALA